MSEAISSHRGSVTPSLKVRILSRGLEPFHGISFVCGLFYFIVAVWMFDKSTLFVTIPSPRYTTKTRYCFLVIPGILESFYKQQIKQKRYLYQSLLIWTEFYIHLLGYRYSRVFGKVYLDFCHKITDNQY